MQSFLNMPPSPPPASDCALQLSPEHPPRYPRPTGTSCSLPESNLFPLPCKIYFFLSVPSSMTTPPSTHVPQQTLPAPSSSLLASWSPQVLSCLPYPSLSSPLLSHLSLLSAPSLLWLSHSTSFSRPFPALPAPAGPGSSLAETALVFWNFSHWSHSSPHPSQTVYSIHSGISKGAEKWWLMPTIRAKVRGQGGRIA